MGIGREAEQGRKRFGYRPKDACIGRALNKAEQCQRYRSKAEQCLRRFGYREGERDLNKDEQGRMYRPRTNKAEQRPRYRP